MAIENWPYTNFHDLNLDWILNELKKFRKELTDFSVNFPHISEWNGGEWDGDHIYGANEIVLYNDGLYIAIKPVPAGTLISNGDYWLKVGEISNVTAETVERVDDLETAVVDIIGELDDLVSLVKTKNIVVIGDSYGTSNGGGGSIANPLPTVLKDYLKMGSDNFHAYFHNGAGFCNGWYMTQLGYALTDLGTDAGKVTDIYFVGGWNDERGRTGVSEADTYNSMDAIYTYCATNFPAAKLHVGFISWYRVSYPVDLAETYKWYKNCVQHGFAYMNNIEYVMHNVNYYGTDNVHPNQTGVNELAYYIAQTVLTGTCAVKYSMTITDPFTPAAGFIGNLNFAHITLYIYVNNGVTTLYVECGANNNVQLNAVDSNGDPENRRINYQGQYIDILDFDSKAIIGYYTNVRGTAYIDFYCYSADGYYLEPVQVDLRINQTDGLSIKMPYRTVPGENIGAVTGIDCRYFRIQNFETSFDTMYL